MAKSRTSKRHAKKRATSPAPVLNSKELERLLTLSVLRHVSCMLGAKTIRSFDTWAGDVAGGFGMDEGAVQGLVEPQVLTTIGNYFGLSEVCNLKAIFQAITGMTSESTRLAATKIVADTVARLEKKT